MGRQATAFESAAVSALPPVPVSSFNRVLASFSTRSGVGGCVERQHHGVDALQTAGSGGRWRAATHAHTPLSGSIARPSKLLPCVEQRPTPKPARQNGHAPTDLPDPDSTHLRDGVERHGGAGHRGSIAGSRHGGSLHTQAVAGAPALVMKAPGGRRATGRILAPLATHTRQTGGSRYAASQQECADIPPVLA